MRTVIYITGIVLLLIVIYMIYVYLTTNASAANLNTPFQKLTGAAGQPSPKPSVDTNTSGRPVDSDTKSVKAGDKLKALEAIPLYKSPELGLANRATTGWLIKTPAYIPTGNYIGFFNSRVGDFIKVSPFPYWTDGLPDVYYIYKSARFTVEPYVI